MADPKDPAVTTSDTAPELPEALRDPAEFLAGVDDVTTVGAAEAAEELAMLARLIERANRAYHTADDPVMDDATYDALRLRNAALEAAFPDLKRADSPSDQVGAVPADGFGKVTHAQRLVDDERQAAHQVLDGFLSAQRQRDTANTQGRQPGGHVNADGIQKNNDAQGNE